jgi:hypothetical protein
MGKGELARLFLHPFSKLRGSDAVVAGALAMLVAAHMPPQ